MTVKAIVVGTEWAMSLDHCNRHNRAYAEGDGCPDCIKDKKVEKRRSHRAFRNRMNRAKKHRP